MTSARQHVAVMNSSIDLVDLIAMILSDDGYEPLTLVSSFQEAPAKERAFLRLHRPNIAVFTVSPPYPQGWDVFCTPREEFPEIGWVVMTTNKRALEEWVGPTESIELVGKPFDIEELVAAVRTAAEGGASKHPVAR